MADNGNCKLKLIHSLSLRRTPASPRSSPASPQALTGTHAVGPFHLWTTPAFFPLLTHVQCPPSSGHLHSLSICSELIFALFLVSLTLFTSAHFLRAFSPTRYFLLSHSNQDRVMVMSEFLGCYCLENPMERGAWWATVHRIKKGWT